jgi:hypothetical protein
MPPLVLHGSIPGEFIAWRLSKLLQIPSRIERTSGTASKTARAGKACKKLKNAISARKY